MPRKGLRPRDRRPDPAPDTVYQSVVVTRMINKIAQHGKHSTARKVLYQALNMIKEKTGGNPIETFDNAIANVRPQVEVRARRVGGATYQVPVEVRPERSLSLSLRWILNAARAKTGKPMAECIGEELLAASKKEGVAFKKREDTHKMAEANRTFAHYRW